VTSSPAVNGEASHAHQKGGSLRTYGFESDELVAVPHRRYSYPVPDLELLDWFSVGLRSRGLTF
jgi:hypothetical protein